MNILYAFDPEARDEVKTRKNMTRQIEDATPKDMYKPPSFPEARSRQTSRQSLQALVAGTSAKIASEKFCESFPLSIWGEILGRHAKIASENLAIVSPFHLGRNLQEMADMVPPASVCSRSSTLASTPQSLSIDINSSTNAV